MWDREEVEAGMLGSGDREEAKRPYQSGARTRRGLGISSSSSS